MTRVRELLPGLRYGLVVSQWSNGAYAHIVREPYGLPVVSTPERGYCGKRVRESDAKVLSRTQIPVCRRCLRLSEGMRRMRAEGMRR